MSINPWTIIIIGLFFLILTWLAILDISRREFSGPNLKLIWGMVVCMVPFLGVIMYLIIGRRTGSIPPLQEGSQDSF